MSCSRLVWGVDWRLFWNEPPQHPGGRLLSAVITANLITITVIALKAFFNISLCVGGAFTLQNIVRVGIKTLILGIIYSIGVNYLLNRYVFYRSEIEQDIDLSTDDTIFDEEKAIPCCCKRKQMVEVE